MGVATDEVLDVAVIGAGPGGSMAAYQLARAGRRVRIYDRRRFPRDKACGDLLAPKSCGLLDSAGLGDVLATGLRLRGMRVVEPTRRRELCFPADSKVVRGFVVPRLSLDDLLLRRAIDVGAEYCQERVTLADDGEGETQVLLAGDRRHHARVVIGADGANSAIARQCGLRATDGARGMAMRQYVTSPDHGLDMFEIHTQLSHALADAPPNSYGWLIPIDRGRLNVGVGILGSSKAVGLRHLLGRFIAGHPLSGTADRRTRRESEPLAGVLRFDFDQSRLVAGRVMVVGDAAGLADPRNGEGISLALESAIIAAEVADGFLATDDKRTLAAYPERMGVRFQRFFDLHRARLGL